MGRSQQTFSKIEKEKKKIKKREEKQKKKEERRANSGKGEGLDSMIAYVDENGFPTDVAPDPKKKVKAENIEIGIPKREKEEFDPVRNGKVAFFNDEKGYGFINDLETQEKHFVHINGLLQEVREGDKVSFELERGLKGMNAVRVKKV